MPVDLVVCGVLSKLCRSSSANVWHRRDRCTTPAVVMADSDCRCSRIACCRTVSVGSALERQLKLWPQPQLLWALGLSIEKPAFCKPSA